MFVSGSLSGSLQPCNDDAMLCSRLSDTLVVAPPVSVEGAEEVGMSSAFRESQEEDKLGIMFCNNLGYEVASNDDEDSSQCFYGSGTASAPPPGWVSPPSSAEGQARGWGGRGAGVPPSSQAAPPSLLGRAKAYITSLYQAVGMGGEGEEVSFLPLGALGAALVVLFSSGWSLVQQRPPAKWAGGEGSELSQEELRERRLLRFDPVHEERGGGSVEGEVPPPDDSDEGD